MKRGKKNENYHPTVLRKVETPTAFMLIDGDVVTTCMKPDVEYNNESAKENLNAIWDYIKGVRVFHMIVPDSTTHITMGANQFADERFEENKKGEALVINTLGHRILSKAFIQARIKRYPIQLFETEEEALAWFDSLRKSEAKD